MADGPALIVQPGGDVPYEYQLAPGESFQLSTISAIFDGGGAPDFFPAVAIYAQSGELLSRTFPGEMIPSGDIAEVTFSPF